MKPNTQAALASLEALTENYLSFLEPYSLEQLQRQPSPDQWSLGQMYIHLIQTALYMQLRNIEACRDGTASAAADKTEAGQNVMALGSFPPVRIQVPPTPQYTPKQPESLEQIRAGLIDVLERMREIEPQLASIPEEATAAHPRLGGLNAKEWFVLAEMHYRHHLLQRERLQQFLAG